MGGKLSAGFEMDVPKLADNVGDAAGWVGHTAGDGASWVGKRIGGPFD